MPPFGSLDGGGEHEHIYVDTGSFGRGCMNGLILLLISALIVVTLGAAACGWFQ
jgi:hypothetical protein